MIEFKRHVKKKRGAVSKDLASLFESLDRKTSHTELRQTQSQAIAELDKRREQRDLVLKISTGAGKTGVGLLWLHSYMEETGEPAVYLCPTVQLVNQVLEEAAKLGISASAYLAGERYPSADATSGKSVVVCTYDKLFNAKTTFDRSDVELRPCAIVLDDAHAGLEEIRDSFTLSINDVKLRASLLKLFEPNCKKQNIGLWQDIENQVASAAIEVPYWIWRPVLSEVHKLLSVYASQNDDVQFVFVWPYLRDMLTWCRCILGGGGIEILPSVVPIEKSRAYDKAKYRLFMSATLADDSSLVRDLGCSEEGARDPIRPKADRGLGERMVLAPALVDPSLDRRWLMAKCATLAKKWKVVVLTPSERLARDWQSVGAEVFIGEAVVAAIGQLRDPQGTVKFAVFPQRYDGVDLPDDSCRILVIDGMPFGEGIADRYDSNIASVQGGARGRLIYRLEQGMGRAVRSHVDYAVVILSGSDLANFIARKVVLDKMNADTRAQLELALDLAKIARDDAPANPGHAVDSMIRQCLTRDPDWKQYYEENARDRSKSAASSISVGPISVAVAERKAADLAMANRSEEAAEILSRALLDANLTDDEESGFLQELAFLQHFADPGEALKTQASAHGKNRSLLRPTAAAPRHAALGKFKAESLVLTWFQQFGHANGAIAAIQDLRARLSLSVSAQTIEQALKELASLLGAIGSRPEQEFGEGPDDLWLWPKASIVIEAKNQNESTLHKSDAGQLLLSLSWFEKTHPERDKPIALMVAKTNIADQKAGFPANTRVLKPEGMSDLLDQLEAFFRELAAALPIFKQPSAFAEKLAARGLTAEQFASKFTVPIQVSK
jgi:hypothetical protein